MSDDRVVLARKDEMSMVSLQWTGEEPEGLSDTEFAEALGATWEGNELVVYDMEEFTHKYDHYEDDWLSDPD